MIEILEQQLINCDAQGKTPTLRYQMVKKALKLYMRLWAAPEHIATTPRILRCVDFRDRDVRLNTPRSLSSDWVKARHWQTSEDGDAGINLQRRSKPQIIKWLSIHRHRYRLWFLFDCGNRRLITIYILIKMRGGDGAGSQNIDFQNKSPCADSWLCF